MAIVILMASSYCFIIILTSADPLIKINMLITNIIYVNICWSFEFSPNNNKINGFLNCWRYFIHVGSSGGALSSLKPIIFERDNASDHVKPVLRSACNRRSTSDAGYADDSAVDNNISLAKFKPSL